ncbi:RelA/SpoT family protein [uncultured Rikenella sp.]|uniref:RelA/SpoT family protein n=1 Tax=uncultured Rikenella sp. TaxID=368003 RepID=UPI00260D278E|nr:RelA/SpoT family protein [uncultured Rikenella sp.]
MNLYRDFLTYIRTTFSASSCDEIRCALHTAVRSLSDLKRYDGTPFVFHSIRTARIVAEEIGLGRNSVISTLLHDVARLGRMPLPEIAAAYGPECAGILRGLNHISAVDPKTSTLQADNFRELIVSYSTDPRVILIKMADRLEVMRALESFPELKRNKKAWETLNLYSQLAHKLGLYGIKSEMEDLSLKYLEPREYDHIVRKLSESDAARQAFIATFVRPIEDRLRALGIRYKLKSRTKSIYSIWRKMRKQRVPFEEVYDLFAIRIIIDCPPDQEKMQCWSVYSVVTDFYTPNPDRMRDWISIPKSNGYESLHTTVVTPQGRWVEVQIRTRRMDEVAERGVAAHWRYKGVGGGGLGSEQWLARLREIVETTAAAETIEERFDLALSSNEVFVFTPTGDLRKLREGSTVLDFAFDIHSNLGMTCTGGRINGRNVSLRERLRNGDVVEIVTSKTQRPRAGWLDIVVTSKAKAKIKQILRDDQARSAQLGKEELERKVKNWKLPLTIEEAVTALSKYYKVKTGFEVYALISEQRLPMGEVKELLTDAASGRLPAPEIQPRRAKSDPSASGDDRSGDCLVIDETLRDVEYKLGGCCHPILGDPIFGFVTVHSGITIHRTDCPNAKRLREEYPYRVLSARWRETTSNGAFLATIRVTGDDLPGLAGRITDLVSQELKLNIRSLSFGVQRGMMQGQLSIEVKGAQAVDMVIHKIKRLKGIVRVFRVNS